VAGLHFSGVYGEQNVAVSARTLKALVDGERPVSVNLRLEAQQEAADGSHGVSHFIGRKGFDTQFLRSTAVTPALGTPWPGIRADLAQGLAVPSDNPLESNELRYTNFGVKYSDALKIPLITAVNIDGNASVRIKRGTDKWFADERLPREVQLNATHFKDPEIDRGHMVRREDPNWGDAAQLANDDTFHYVNAAAQHSRLNQGKELWQGLENYILDSARTHDFKACVFTGPVLRDGDDEEIVIDGAIAPAEFWKVVVTLDADDKALHATAYLLSQGQLIRKLLEDRSRRESFEGVVLGAYRTFQVAISDLAEGTGHDFSAYVNADPLRKTNAGQEALATGEPVFLSLDDVEDIIL
jgi:endonuclease G